MGSIAARIATIDVDARHRPRRHRSRHSATLAALITMALGAGCASTPPPTEQIAVSKNAIESASSSGGTEFAGVELKSAQDKLAAAEQAMAQKEYEQARKLAEEAQVDAKLAETKARSTKAQKAVQDTQDSLRTLQNEANRNLQNNNAQ